MIPKFRAWKKAGKELGRVGQITFELDGSVSHVLFKGEFLDFNVSINEIILMQSTGLHDKNGKEIFEGDIISDGHMSRDIRHHQTLGFYTIDGNGVEGFFGDTASLEDFEEVSKYMSENIEIIGNIYENPELLEDGK